MTLFYRVGDTLHNINIAVNYLKLELKNKSFIFK